MTTPASPFFEQPILNSPYEEPTRYHPLDAEGQPLNEPPRDGRRKSELITPVPKPRKKKRKNAGKDQASLDLSGDDGLSTEEQEYNPTPIINEIRSHVGEWRRSNPAVWGVTPATARLLNYWRSHQFQGVRPFAMLTEGWDTNTVTHILGVRAFGTQLLCEQVVGRGLRRYSYDLNAEGLFNVEYADIMGIPFDFTAKPQVAPVKPPKKMTRVAAVRERATLEMIFPRVVGYRIELPEEKLEANFTSNSKLILTPDMVGPGQTLLEGIVGEGVTLTVAEMKDKRPSTVSYELAKYLLYSYFRDADGEPKLHLFYQIQRIVRRWIDEGYLECKGGTGPWMLQILSIATQAAERIYNGIAAAIGDEERIRAVLDPYNPKGSTRHVGFMTSKDLYTTHPAKCHINYVVCDSDWEAEFARAAEDHQRVLSYVKNRALGLEVPYKDGSTARFYLPDFIVNIDDGRGPDDPLHLIVEVKGYRRENVKLKSETMRQKWIRGVNNLGTYGRWAFEEFNDVFEIQKEFAALIDRAVGANGDSSHLSTATGGA